MNINSDSFRYKKVVAIREVQRTLRGKLLEFTFGSTFQNPSEIICSSDIIYYYDETGEPKENFASQVKVGDFLMERKEKVKK